jgi:hypothetical protein
MKKINKYIIAAVFAGMFGLTGCEKDFLDINQDPNSPASSTPDLVLPSGTLAVGFTMGEQFQFLGNIWAQHWTQSFVANQYKELDKYQISTSTNDRPWQYLYAGALNDFKYVSERAKGDSTNYAAIADIMTAYTYQVIVDAWDQAPFTEALQGNKNLNPHYDKGQEIYRSLIPIIDGGLAKINTSSPVQIGTEDLIFEGDMDLWKKFANTLKLKIYLRQVYVDRGYAEAGIRKLYADNAQFLDGNEDAELTFVNKTANMNPAYMTEVLSHNGINILASKTIIDYMTGGDPAANIPATNDPRVDVFFDRPNGSATAAHFGAGQGAAGVPNAPATPRATFSTPDEDNIMAPTTAVPFISGAESLFLQAEAALRFPGLGNAETLYNQGIEASFDYWETPGATTFIAQPSVNLASATGDEAKIERIITQKWVSMSGRQGFEAWTELRRTGYPSFIKPSLSSTLGAGRFPNRLLFADSEQTRNPNTPGIVDVFVPVWWDTKN